MPSYFMHKESAEIQTSSTITMRFFGSPLRRFALLRCLPVPVTLVSFELCWCDSAVPYLDCSVKHMVGDLDNQGSKNLATCYELASIEE